MVADTGHPRRLNQSMLERRQVQLPRKDMSQQNNNLLGFPCRMILLWLLPVLRLVNLAPDDTLADKAMCTGGALFSKGIRLGDKQAHRQMRSSI